MPVGISAVINTYNEEANIADCLECLKGFVDEIVISDMHSTDRTIEIARNFTQRISYQPKREFVGKVREAAVARASHDWIFVIDCDERVQPALFTELRRVAASGTAAVVRIHRLNRFCGVDLTDRGWSREWVERFFRREAVRFRDHPHDWIECLAPAIDLSTRFDWSIDHHAHPTLRSFIHKMNGYTESEAELMDSLGWSMDFRRVALRPTRMFFHHFFRLRGYRAGAVGFSYSTLMALYWLVAALKLGERRSMRKIPH